MRIHLLLTLLLLVTREAHGDPAAPFLEADFGPPVASLRLAVTVDADGATAEFRIQNVGRRRATFAKEYSCSGPPFAIRMGMSATSLDASYAFDAKVKGLSRTSGTSCTVNVPRKFVTVAPGKTVTVPVPFATKGEILGSKETTFQASAFLGIQRRQGLVVLQSSIVKRP